MIKKTIYTIQIKTKILKYMSGIGSLAIAAPLRVLCELNVNKLACFRFMTWICHQTLERTLQSMIT